MKLFLDWTEYKDAGMGDAYADIPKTGGDFAKAISVCINSRQCESKQKGVMCPSFRVTDNKDLSTGGRVQLLKTALNGQSDGETINDPLLEHALLTPTLKEAMDLCVACKGCKRECENSVDMAMIKIEYLAQTHQFKRLGIRTRLLANLSVMLNQGQVYKWMLYKLIQLRNRFSGLSRFSEKVLGLSAKRQLPVPATFSFDHLRDGSIKAVANSIDAIPVVDEVVLLIDTFTNHFCPENAEAAIRVLNSAGYLVHVVGGKLNGNGHLCCGRTQLANGLVKEAINKANRMIDVLLPHVEAGRQIIGLEPACLLAIRDDYKFLGLGQTADKVARHAILFEEFIAKEIQAKRFKPAFKPIVEEIPILVHGHCHQKAVGAMKSMRKVLKLLPNQDFTFIESSCCGMAGSFGLEKEHAELSMKMAEDQLLPALREQPNARIIANGFSCRHQIKEGANRSSMHLALLLDQALLK